MTQLKIEEGKIIHRELLIRELKKAINNNNFEECLIALNANRREYIYNPKGETVESVSEVWNGSQMETIVERLPLAITLHGPYLTDQDIQDVLHEAIKKSKPHIIDALYQHEMNIHVREFNEFNLNRKVNKSIPELQLDFALHTHNTKLVGIILAGSPDYREDKKLFKRLYDIAPIMKDLAQLEEIYKKNPTKELGWAISGMQLNVKQFITGKTSEFEFKKNATESAERSIVNLQKHSEGWTILKNILLALTGIGMDKAVYNGNRMIIENTTTSKVREMKEKLQNMKLENPAPSEKIKKSEEINQEPTSYKPN